MTVTYDVPTPAGDGRAHLDGPADAPLLVLGHGAGGGPDAADLLAARSVARALGWAVARTEQPYRVRGRRVAEGAARLDAAFVALVAALGPRPGLVVGGRSSGARVACRTATVLGAGGVLCLAFPLVPPRGPSRLPELLAPGVPRLVVQGSRDAFGVPEAGPGVEVAVVHGADHAFGVRRRDGRSRAEVLAEVEERVAAWLVDRAGQPVET